MLTTQTIAIIGTGSAGLAAGRCLRAAIPHAQIVLYDAAPKSGGRLRSIATDADGSIVELGGARFHPSHHPLVHALATELQLPMRPYVCNLSPLQGAFSGHIRDVLRDLLAKLQNRLELGEGVGCDSVSFSEIAAKLLGEDALDLLVTAVGYDALRHPSMTLQAGMHLLHNHPETATLWAAENGWLTLAAGFQSLTNRLEADLRDSCEFRFGYRLRGFNTSGDDCELHFDTDTGCIVEHADYVVFALPIRELEQIGGIRIPKVVSEAVIDIPLFKVYFQFDTPWWLSLQLQGQCITTSTLFRKIYFPEKGDCLLVYCDGPSALGLRDLFTEGTKGEVAAAFYEAIEESQPGAITLDHVITARLGWAFWEQGVSFWKQDLCLMPSNSLPLSDRHYFCSDLCTTANGWVEGALISAMETARRISGHIASQSATRTEFIPDKIEEVRP